MKCSVEVYIKGEESAVQVSCWTLLSSPNTKMLSLLYLFGVLASLPVLAFLLLTAYLHYVHWKYSHIPQPKRPRYYCSQVQLYNS